MKKLFENQNVTLYKVQKDLKLELKRLYHYVDGTCDIKNMPTQLLLDLAVYFKMHPKELYKEMLEYQKKNKR